MRASRAAVREGRGDDGLCRITRPRGSKVKPMCPRQGEGAGEGGRNTEKREKKDEDKTTEQKKGETPDRGLDPPTLGLKVQCSTD